MTQKLLGKTTRIPGLSLFSINVKTGEIVDLGQNQKKVIIDQDCIYRQALNKKNFIKKLFREGILVKKQAETT